MSFKKNILLFTCRATLLLFSTLFDQSEAWSRDDGLGGKLASNVDLGNYESGIVNGITIKIPKNYLQSGIVYKSEAAKKERPSVDGENPTLEIADFGILLRLSTLQPIASDEDLRDWTIASSTARPGFLNSWMMVDFDNRYPVNILLNKEMPENIRRDAAHWGPFVRDKVNHYGLVHYESIQSVDSGSSHGYVEYFYSETSLTNIVCATHRIKVPPFDTYDECHHRFLISSLNLMAEAFYTKKDLARWRDIEVNVRKIVESFIAHQSK